MPWTRIPEYPNSSDRLVTYQQAIHEALRQALDIDPSVFILGEGVDDPGGVFGTTQGLVDLFGKDRVMDMPVAENSMAGIAIGASHTGMRPVCVHMRTDFLLMAMDQIANHAAKWNYMFAGRVKTPIVFRAIIGRGWGSGAQHSQALHPLFMHFPGLRIVAPSSPRDAKGMLLGAIKCDDPVLIFEHRWLYNVRGEVPEGPYSSDLDSAEIICPGKDVTVVTSGLSSRVAVDCRSDLVSQGVSPEIIDLRSLKPLDIGTIGQSVLKTGRLIVFDYSWPTCGLGSEIISRISQEFFHALKKPPVNISLPECPVPASPSLERAFYPGEENLMEAVFRLLS
jgi:acetoin:2,6-dichlorophenolindophenol oxidoreductase subunit beta